MYRNTETLYIGNLKENGGYATIDEIKSLLNLEIELENNIYDKFLIENVIKDTENSKIKGSKNIINLFESLGFEKYDFKMRFEDIKYIGINEKEEVIINFPTLNISASGIYNFSAQFYDKFKLSGYARHCIEINRHDIILRNINEMLPAMKEEENQYRLLKKDNENYLRALTSKNYKNYDNKISIYLILYALEKIANDNGHKYYVQSGYIGDSSIDVLFVRENYEVISDVCKVNFSLNISNSEIADEALRVSLGYIITDNEGRTFPGTLKEPICRITHTMNMETFQRRSSKVFSMEEYESNVLDIINTINTDEQLSQDGIYYLLKRAVERITDDRDITKETKDKYRDLRDSYIIESTLTLMETFDKLSSIETDISERIFIERIFHQVIQDYAETRKIRKQKLASNID